MIAPTIGVEEEFLLLDPRTGVAATVAPRLLELEPAAEAELMTYQVETATDVCGSLGDVRSQLRESRARLADAADRAGALLVATGTAPFGHPGLEALTPGPRYRQLARHAPDQVRDAGSAGCHIHVGLDDRDVGARVLTRLRPWLPALLALSANSPFRDGRDSGLASARYATWSRWPTAVPPPVVPDAAAFDAAVAEAVSTGAAMDVKSVYYLARLSPQYPTVEVRVADVCLTVDDAVLLTGLVRALVSRCTMDVVADAPLRLAPDAQLVPTLAAVARHGLEGSVPHPQTGSLVPAWQLVDELVSYVRSELDDNGDAEEVYALLGELHAVGGGADRQRRWAAQAGSPGDVATTLAEATLQESAFGVRDRA
jgi:carboxylate-amine ligase